MALTSNVKQVFEPLLKEFCETTSSIDIDKGFPTVFIPHTMQNYCYADRKVFYFGRDTYGWQPTSQLMEAYAENNLSKYIETTSNWINDFGFLSYNNNKSSGFWTLALRLHLRLKGFSNDLRISERLPKEYYDHINDFGYGNTNAIEVPKSLEKQGIWTDLNKEKYWAVKEKSKMFDSLTHTIQAYKPDLVFIFNWDCNEHKFLEGLNYTEQRLDLINNHFIVYTLPDTNTRIIWTAHPTAARWFGYGTDRIIDEIVSYLNDN